MQTFLYALDWHHKDKGDRKGNTQRDLFGYLHLGKLPFTRAGGGPDHQQPKILDR